MFVILDQSLLYVSLSQIRDCQLFGLLDLDHSSQDTSAKLVEMMNRMIGYGVAGYRIDAAIYIRPSEMEEMWHDLDTLKSEYFPQDSKPFFYHHVRKTKYDYFTLCILQCSLSIHPSYQKYEVFQLILRS